MRYVGIDIAKKDHQIAAVDEFGNVILKSFSAGNNESGFAKIAEKLEAARIESDECLVGMERPATTGSRSGSSSTPTATRSWSSTYPDRRIPQSRLAPQNENRRHRQRAHRRVPALANPTSSKMANPDVEQLRELARFRSFLVEQATQLKNKAIRVLDQAFPEYGSCSPTRSARHRKPCSSSARHPKRSSQLTSARSRASSRKTVGQLRSGQSEAVKDAARSSIGAKFGRPCPVLRDQSCW
mgnify:CR=1 FL=1